uniref:Uncharacterized protein n=1 Tax=Anopheles culicifacies TaxID=139723 RepID=A0A182MPG6_9DIPT
MRKITAADPICQRMKKPRNVTSPLSMAAAGHVISTTPDYPFRKPGRKRFLVRLCLLALFRGTALLSLTHTLPPGFESALLLFQLLPGQPVLGTETIVCTTLWSFPSSSAGFVSSAWESPEPDRESASLRYVFSGLLLISSLLSGLWISVSMLDPSVGSSSSSSSTCSSWTYLPPLL